MRCLNLVNSKVQIGKKKQRKIVNIFLFINFNICFGCSKEPSQHMFWLKNKKTNFSLSGGLGRYSAAVYSLFVVVTGYVFGPSFVVWFFVAFLV